MKNLRAISNHIESISSIKGDIYKHINTHRYQQELVEDFDVWNKICSSLDVIADTLMSISDYSSSSYPKTTGLQYIYTYGILQALFIQQDAVENLTESFDIKYERTGVLKKIRYTRNSAVGHPTKENVRKEVFFNYISRGTMRKNGFEYMRSNKDAGDAFIKVDLDMVIEDQLSVIQKKLFHISTILTKKNEEHMAKYGSESMINIFPSTMGYFFEKISTAISSPSEDRTSFALHNLEKIKEVYEDFEKEISRRNENSDGLTYEINQYYYAINKIHEFLEKPQSSVSERDARIYFYYIRNEHYEFVKIAKEYDDEYQEKTNN